MTLYVSYEAFLPEVVPYVRDCPEFVAVNAIRNACMEFCEKTTYWRQVLDPITIVANQAEYDLDIELGSTVATIMSARLGSRPLAAMSEEQLRDMVGADWRIKTGDPMFIISEEHDMVRLVYIPTAVTTETLNLTVALRPLKSSTRIPKEIYERYAEVIGFGARARLHDTPGQPYSDENAAAKFRKWFESGYGEATIAANRSRGRGPLTVRMPRYI